MQPQLDQQSVPTNYLDQIAVQQHPTGPNRKFILFIVAGLAVTALIFIAMAVMSSLTPKITDDLYTLNLRLQSLQDISKKSQANIKSGQLRDYNINLTTFLLDTSNNLQEPLEKSTVNLKKIPKKISADEKKIATDLTTKFDDARLFGSFDETYSQEMAHQLKLINLLMSKMHKVTKNKSLKTFIETTNTQLKVLYKDFDTFDPYAGSDFNAKS